MFRVASLTPSEVPKLFLQINDFYPFCGSTIFIKGEVRPFSKVTHFQRKLLKKLCGRKKNYEIIALVP